jgi:hypothetical protein
MWGRWMVISCQTKPSCLRYFRSLLLFQYCNHIIWLSFDCVVNCWVERAEIDTEALVHKTTLLRQKTNISEK